MAFRDRAFPSGLIIEEDPIRSGVTGKPEIHHAIHPRRHEPLWNQIYACRDALFDPHSDVLSLVKTAALGFLIGGSIGFTHIFVARTNRTFAMRKAFKYIRDNQFGSSTILKDTLMPYALGGAATGVSYWLFWRTVWRSDTSKMWNMIVGNGVFSALATAILFNPRFWWAGLYGGAFGGFVAYSLIYRNMMVHKESGNVVLKLSGKTEEEREKQKHQDYIHELGLNPLIIQGRLVTL